MVPTPLPEDSAAAGRAVMDSVSARCSTGLGIVPEDIQYFELRTLRPEEAALAVANGSHIGFRVKRSGAHLPKGPEIRRRAVRCSGPRGVARRRPARHRKAVTRALATWRLGLPGGTRRCDGASNIVPSSSSSKGAWQLHARPLCPTMELTKLRVELQLAGLYPPFDVIFGAGRRYGAGPKKHP